METNCSRWAFARLGVILCASDPRRDYQEPATPAVVRRGNNIDEFDPLELDVIHNIMSNRYSERSPAVMPPPPAVAGGPRICASTERDRASRRDQCGRNGAVVESPSTRLHSAPPPLRTRQNRNRRHVCPLTCQLMGARSTHKHSKLGYRRETGHGRTVLLLGFGFRG
jgi:hypothetical protein